MYDSPFYAPQGRGAFTDNNTRSSLPALAPLARSAFRAPICDDQTVLLLADWLTGERSEEKTARLAAKLLFHRQERGAELYLQSRLGTLDLKEAAELKALSLFPNKDASSLRGAFLAGHYFGDKEVLTVAERRELAALLSFPNNEKARVECEKWLSSLSKEGSAAKQQRGINEIVRGVTSMSLAYPVSLGHLSYLLDCDHEIVRQAMLDPVSGLDAHERKAWERHSSVSTTLLKNPLLLATADALRKVLALDTFLYSVGIKDKLLPDDALTALFPLIAETPIAKCAPRERDRYLRDYVGQGEDGGMHEVRHSLVYSALHEIEIFKAGEIRSLRSDEDLARLEGISTITVERILEEGLSESAYRFRNTALKSACRVPHCESLAEYRRAELHALTEGEITSVRTESDLAKRFNLSLQQVKENTTNALTRDELLLLDIALKVREQEGLSDEAAMLIMQHKLFDQLNTQHVAFLKNDIVKGSNAKVTFRGCDFDSFEEAALAILLTTHLPGFELQPGVTFQVPNSGKFHDFVIDGVFGGELRRIVLEYHRARPYYSPSKGGDFDSYEEYQQYQRIKESFSSSTEREQFENQVLVELGANYHEKRRLLLESHPKFKDFELITVIDPLETYHELKRLNVSLPEKGIFLNQFHTTVKRLKAAQK